LLDTTTSSPTDFSQTLAQKNARIAKLKTAVRARDAGFGPFQVQYERLRKRMLQIKGQNQELEPRIAEANQLVALLQRQLDEMKAENARLKRGVSGDSAASEHLLRDALALKAEAQAIVANGLSQEHFLNDLSQQKREFEGIAQNMKANQTRLENRVRELEATGAQGIRDLGDADAVYRKAAALKAEAQGIVDSGLSQEHFLDELRQQKAEFERMMREMRERCERLAAENERLKAGRGEGADLANARAVYREAAALKAEAQRIVSEGMGQERLLSDFVRQQRDFGELKDKYERLVGRIRSHHLASIIARGLLS
jgi:chromosome segregation ATPase